MKKYRLDLNGKTLDTKDIGHVITNDLILYGESYIRLYRDGDIVYRERIDPSDIIINLDKKMEDD